MRIRRLPVVWKKEGDTVLIQSNTGVYLLRKRAANLWMKLEKDKTVSEPDPLINALLEARLVESIS